MGKTIQSRRVSPRLSSGRPPILSPAQVDELEAFVCSLPETRQMSYLELSKNFPEWNVGEPAIGNALHRRRYSRHIARQKPLLSDENMALRLESAISHRNWTIDNWCRILWSDETYISDKRPASLYITRKVDLIFFYYRKIIFEYLLSLKVHEENEATYIVSRYRNNNY